MGGAVPLALFPNAALPLTENPRETMAWVLPYWQERIVRALVQHLGHLYDEQVAALAILTSVPLVYASASS
jgi:bisphosphoglycerate-dependent phosphoglycerate mutase